MPLSVDERLASIKAAVFDVDGVLTPGKIIYGPEGEFKVFDVQDGHGFKMAWHTDLKIGWLSGLDSEPVRRMAAELKIDTVFLGIKNKAAIVDELCEKLGVEPSEICYTGDDVIDLPVMRRAGVSFAVPNAMDIVQEQADEVTRRRGGDGAAREVLDRIFKARGDWDHLMERYLKS